MNFDAIRDFLKYTMTFALAGWGYTQKALGTKDTFFGAPEAVTLWVTVFVFAAFLLCLLFGVFYLSGMTGMASLSKRAAEFEAERHALDAARLFRGEDPVAEVEGEAANRAAMLEYEKTAERNASWHFGLLGAAYFGAGILFVENLFDGPPASPDCAVRYEDGALVVETACTEQS